MTDRYRILDKYKKMKKRIQKKSKMATSLGKEVYDAEIALCDQIIHDLHWLGTRA